MAQEGWANDGIVDIVARKYLAALKGKKIDTLILGCTHYPLLRSSIQRVMGKGVKLIDSAEETAKEAKNLLEECGLKSAAKRKTGSRFYVSDAPDKFRAVAKRFLGKDTKAVEKVDDV